MCENPSSSCKADSVFDLWRQRHGKARRSPHDHPLDTPDTTVRRGHTWHRGTRQFSRIIWRDRMLSNLFVLIRSPVDCHERRKSGDLNRVPGRYWKSSRDICFRCSHSWSYSSLAENENSLCYSSNSVRVDKFVAGYFLIKDELNDVLENLWLDGRGYAEGHFLAKGYVEGYFLTEVVQTGVLGGSTTAAVTPWAGSHRVTVPLKSGGMGCVFTTLSSTWDRRGNEQLQQRNKLRIKIRLY